MAECDHTSKCSDKELNQPFSSQQDIALFIVGGPAGCGKSTIAKTIARSTHIPFIEGDDLHSAESRAKMAAGYPLVDDDRWDWLDRLVSRAREVELGSPAAAMVITCSSLKKSYRDRIRKRVEEFRGQGSKLRAWFLFCKLSQEEAIRRVRAREGQVIKMGVMAGQFADLQLPDPDQESRVYVLDVERNISEVEKDAVDFVWSCIGSLEYQSREE